MAGNSQLVNLEYLESMTGGSPELVREMIDIFITQVPEFIIEMNDCYGKKDWKTLGMIAHKAKSSVAIMGMNELAVQLKEFELAALSGGKQEMYETYINDFIDKCNHAIEELNQIKDNI